MTPDLPPPVEAPELWGESPKPPSRRKDDGQRPPDPEHGPGDDTATGEPPD